jgi:hypothetical protein
VHPANACGVQSRCSGTAVQIAGLARRNLSPCFARAAVHHPRYQFDRMLLPVRESLIGGRHTSRRPRLLVVPGLVDCCSLLQTVVGLRCITAVGAAPIMARHAVKQCERAAFMHSCRSARLTAAQQQWPQNQKLPIPVQLTPSNSSHCRIRLARV